jgi:hypothetical protein
VCTASDCLTHCPSSTIRWVGVSSSSTGRILVRVPPETYTSSATCVPYWPLRWIPVAGSTSS